MILTNQKLHTVFRVTFCCTCWSRWKQNYQVSLFHGMVWPIPTVNWRQFGRYYVCNMSHSGIYDYSAELCDCCRRV